MLAIIKDEVRTTGDEAPAYEVEVSRTKDTPTSVSIRGTSQHSSLYTTFSLDDWNEIVSKVAVMIVHLNKASGVTK